MLDQLNASLDEYLNRWQELISHRKDARNVEFFERLKPTAAGWKVTDAEEYERLLDELRPACDIIAEIWMNDRWIAKLHLKDRKLAGDIEMIKLMQRRPGSTDAVGLDHVDFLDMEETNTVAILAEETDIRSTKEVNGDVAWTSIWFDGGEAKLKGYTVIDNIVDDLQKVNNKIRGKRFAVAERADMLVADVE